LMFARAPITARRLPGRPKYAAVSRLTAERRGLSSSDFRAAVQVIR
jgi:hypothetical protein